MVPEKFGYDDLNKILAIVEVMPDNFEKVLEAWNIDLEGFVKFIRDGAKLSPYEFMQMVLEPEKATFSAMTVGFQLGFQTAQEMELRKK